MEVLLAIALILAFISTIVFTILAYVFVLSKKREELEHSGFLTLIYDLLNIRELYSEKIWHFFYVFSMISVVSIGAFLVFFGWVEDYGGGVMWIGYLGIAAIIGGPIALRVSYEMIMLLPLCVKHLMSIDKKINADSSFIDDIAREVEPSETPESGASSEEVVYAHCEHCKGRIRVRESLLWGYVKCPHCNSNTIAIPYK